MGLVANYRLALFLFDYLVVFFDTTCFPFSPRICGLCCLCCLVSRFFPPGVFCAIGILCYRWLESITNICIDIIRCAPTNTGGTRQASGFTAFCQVHLHVPPCRIWICRSFLPFMIVPDEEPAEFSLRSIPDGATFPVSRSDLAKSQVFREFTVPINGKLQL